MRGVAITLRMDSIDQALIEARQAEELEVDGYKYQVISLADLITAKVAMGREKDLLTAKELRAIAAKREQAKAKGS
jgi:predicted nucleotidyltransferase